MDQKQPVGMEHIKIRPLAVHVHIGVKPVMDQLQLNVLLVIPGCI